jgi:hypothetical protein
MPFLLLGVDSLIAAFALGGLAETRRSRVRIAALFGSCDAGATLAGTFIHLPAAQWSGALVAAYGLYLLTAFATVRAGIDQRAAYVLPALLSLDNLAYGASHAAALLPQAMLLGMVSASFALAGFAVHRAAGRSPACGVAFSFALAGALNLWV